MKTKTNQHINQGGMDSWSNKQSVIEGYTRGRLADAYSGGTMFLAHSMHGEVENLFRVTVSRGNMLCMSHLKVPFNHIREFLKLIPRLKRAFKCEESADRFSPSSPMPFA